MTDSKTFGRKNRITSYTAYNYRVRKKANTVGFSLSCCKEERVWRGPEYFAPVKRYISINSPNNDCPVSRRLRTSSYITLSVPGHYITNNDNCGLGGLPAGLSRTGGWWTWIRSITKTPVMLTEGPKTRFLCFKASIHQARRPPLVSILLLCPQFSQPLLSIIDPQHTNGNDNQWGHLYTLANIANGRILKKVGTPPFFVCCWIDATGWKGRVSILSSQCPAR